MKKIKKAIKIILKDMYDALEFILFFVGVIAIIIGFRIDAEKTIIVIGTIVSVGIVYFFAVGIISYLKSLHYRLSNDEDE